jgi:hypothetical protein
LNVIAEVASFRLSPWIPALNYLLSVYLHHVDVDCVTEILEIHTASIFRVYVVKEPETDHHTHFDPEGEDIVYPLNISSTLPICTGAELMSS